LLWGHDRLPPATLLPTAERDKALGFSNIKDPNQLNRPQ
jgi:hypothetical protein